MNIGILSGKGGTGKTTVSTNLSILLHANYIDCDVEEPNGFIFLNPQDIKSRSVEVDFPSINLEQCTFCGGCVKACQFNALAKVKDDLILFEKLCHGCGACSIACQENAITYQKRKIGYVEEGQYQNQLIRRGILDIGEPMAVPILKNIMKDLPKGMNILDCPPGTSCNVVNILQYMDAAVLVTEPTVFGLHDLKMAVELTRQFQIPFGVVINKSTQEEGKIEEYCKKEGIPIYGKIPYSKEAAEIYSRGFMLIDIEKFRKVFNNILENMRRALRWNL